MSGIDSTEALPILFAWTMSLKKRSKIAQNSASLALVWRSQVKPSSRGPVGKPRQPAPRTTQATDAESGNATGAHQAKGTVAQRPNADLSAPKLEHDHLCNETKFESFLVGLSGGRSVALEDQVVEMLVEGRHALELRIRDNVGRWCWPQSVLRQQFDTDLFRLTQRNRTLFHRTYPTCASQLACTNEQDPWWPKSNCPLAKQGPTRVALNS